MNQPTKAFLTEFRDFCRRHNVEFYTRGPLDGKGMSFLSVGCVAPWIHADVESLEDLEAQLADVEDFASHSGILEEDTGVDDSMDGDHDSAMASAGWGTDEDYGHYGPED